MKHATVCPFCAGPAVTTYVAEWDATQQDEPDKTNELDEHKCANKGADCEGRSFWT